MIFKSRNFKTKIKYPKANEIQNRVWDRVPTSKKIQSELSNHPETPPVITSVRVPEQVTEI